MRALPIFLTMTMMVTACGAETPDSSAPRGAASQVAATTQPAAEKSTTPTAALQADADLLVGSIAPSFELPGSDGATHTLGDYAGQHVVLAFFPKAFTGG